MKTKTILIVAICVVCAATLMSGCLNDRAACTYIGYSLDVGFVDGRYTQYENVVDVNTVYEETGYYTIDLTFANGSKKCLHHVKSYRSL